MEFREAYVGDKKAVRVYKGKNIVFPKPVLNGLVLWYDFMGMSNRDPKRTIAEDLSGNGNDGTLQNFAYQNGSGYVKGLKLDGADDYISLPANDLIRPSEITIEAILDIDFINGYGTLLSARISTNAFIIFINGGNLLIQPSSTSNRWTFPHPRTNEVKYFSFTITSTNAKVFVNGVKVGEISGNFPLEYGSQFFIGRDTSIAQYFLSGTLKSLKMYNRALTPEEIQHNYQMEKERWNL